MSEKEAIDFIESEIQKRIKSFDERRKFYRKGTFQSTMLTALLSATTTFLIGFGQIYNLTIVSIIALATSSFMTVVSAWESFYNYRPRWIQNNDTLMKLYELNSDIKYQKSLKGSHLNTEEIDKFYQRYEVILRAANENWKDDRSVQSK